MSTNDDSIVDVSSHRSSNHRPSLIESSAIAPLDRRIEKKISGGKVSIEARLDLHGLTLEQGFRRVHDFLPSCHDRGLRTVLIITGRGREDKETLRSGLPKWLGTAALSGIVSGLCPARRRHGGEGAFYVRLKKSK